MHHPVVAIADRAQAKTKEPGRGARGEAFPRFRRELLSSALLTNDRSTPNGQGRARDCPTTMMTPRFLLLLVASAANGLQLQLFQKPLMPIPLRMRSAMCVMSEDETSVAADVDVTPAASEIKEQEWMESAAASTGSKEDDSLDEFMDEETWGEEEEVEMAQDDPLVSLGSWRTQYDSAAEALAQARAEKEEATAGLLQADADFLAAIDKAKAKREEAYSMWLDMESEATLAIAEAEADMASAMRQAEAVEVTAKQAAAKQKEEAAKALQRAVDEAAAAQEAADAEQQRLMTALDKANGAVEEFKAKAETELKEMATALQKAQERADKAKAAAIAAIGDL